MRIALLAGLILCAAAHAQQPQLGAALRSRPDYDGSSEKRSDVVPIVRYYGRPWFARTTQGVLEAGVRSELDRDFWVGAQVAYEEGRDHAPQIDAGLSAGLHLEWDRPIGPVPVSYLVRARQHLDGDLGAQADLRITAGLFARGGWAAAIFGQATWGTENAIAARYGPRNSGLLFTSVGLLGTYDLGPRWLLTASLERRQLHDEVAASALAERKAGHYATAGIAYRFGR